MEVVASLPAAGQFLLGPSLPGPRSQGSGQEWAVTNPCLLLSMCAAAGGA